MWAVPTEYLYVHTYIQAYAICSSYLISFKYYPRTHPWGQHLGKCNGTHFPLVPTCILIGMPTTTWETFPLPPGIMMPKASSSKWCLASLHLDTAYSRFSQTIIPCLYFHLCILCICCLLWTLISDFCWFLS